MSKRARIKNIGKGLAGAVAIASGTSAYGSIVTVPVPADLTNSPGGANTTVNWNVDGVGGNDFTFNNRYPNTTTGSGVVWQMNMNPATGTSATNGVVSYLGPFVRYAFALAANTSIGTGSPFSTVTQLVLGSQYLSGGIPMYYGGFAAGPNGNGAVTPGTVAFAGFRFSAPDGTHYGWIALSTSAGTIHFVNAAYETTPGMAIPAGVPEPGTMAMLAMGAAGLLGAVIKRRRS